MSSSRFDIGVEPVIRGTPDSSADTKGHDMALDTMQIGVQSWCFRHFKNGDEIARIKECGVSTVELSHCHVDVSNEASVESAIARYKAAGLKIVSLGVQGIANDREKEEKSFRLLQRVGAKFMSVDFRGPVIAECAASGQRLADQYGIRLAIHNHGRSHRLGSSWMLQEVFDQTGPQIGLCLDTAWALDAGEDPIKMVERFGSRLYGVHFKDFVFDRAGKPQDVVTGTGNLDLVLLRDALRKVNFNGFAVIEYEGDVENPVPAVKKCVQAIREVFAR